MCFGGGTTTYNAYKSGDFDRWKSMWDIYTQINDQVRHGDTSPAVAEALKNTENALTTLEKPIKEDSGATIELRNIQSQYKVGAGKENIDKNFERFSPDYYDQYRKDYTDYYNPQLDDQYRVGQGDVTSAMANRGMLASTASGGAMSDLLKKYQTARTGIADEAQNASDKLKGNVESSKSSLYSLNQASADPESANTRSLGEATALVAPATHSPLGQIFADTIQPIVNYNQARQNRTGGGYQSFYRGVSKTGSGRVVGS